MCVGCLLSRRPKSIPKSKCRNRKWCAYGDGTHTHLFLFCYNNDSRTTITTICIIAFIYIPSSHRRRRRRSYSSALLHYTNVHVCDSYRVLCARTRIYRRKKSSHSCTHDGSFHFVSIFSLPIRRRFVSWTAAYMTTLNLTRSQTCLNVATRLPHLKSGDRQPLICVFFFVSFTFCDLLIDFNSTIITT